MIQNLATGAVLVVITWFAGYGLWQCIRRNICVRKTLADSSLLSKYITRNLIERTRTMYPEYTTNRTGNSSSYAMNIFVLFDSDRKSVRRIMLIWVVLLVAVFVASSSLGVGFVIANGVILILSALPGLSRPGSDNASTQVIQLATVLHSWHSENPSECEEFANQTRTITTLYQAVKAAR